MKKLKYFFCCGLLLVTSFIQANNIQVTNVALREQNTAAKTLNVQFNLSWDNSWRTSSAPNNWDAAWVFVKFRVGTGDWQHATLSSVPDDHTAPFTPVASTITPASDGKGVFIYRSDNGTGTFNLTGVKLNWLYGTDGVADLATVRVRVFAVEMVYVPQGSFFVGSGGTEMNSFTDGSWTGGSNPSVPFQIISENTLSIQPTAGNLYARVSNTTNIGLNGNLPAAYPKGFAAFYCMKYELSQGQYRDFLNTLTRAQQDSRTATALAVGTTSVTNRYVMSGKSTLTNRNGIRCDGTVVANNPINFYCDLDGDGTPNESNDGEWIACNFLSLLDATAYADWAGLRPMTELEFEKACRGTQAAVSDEYGWGNNIIASAAYSLSNPGIINESISTNYSTTAGNTSYYTTAGSIYSPLRVGIFATSTSNRIQSGASYYGIMELSGNLWELCVNVINDEGRNYTGSHGDGQLSVSGNANTAQWPGLITGGDWFGAGGRGGSFASFEASLKVSGRDLSIYPDNLGDRRYLDLGFRAVRTAPN